MRLRLGWLVRCRSTIFIKFHPLRRSFHQLLLSFIFFSIEEERRLCDAKESQSTKPVSWSLILPWLLLAESGNTKGKARKSLLILPWLLLALARVRKSLLIPSLADSEKPPSQIQKIPLLCRVRKTSFAESGKPSSQIQENHLPLLRKTSFPESGKPPSQSQKKHLQEKSGKQIMVPLLVASALGNVRAKLPWRDLQRQR